MRLDEIALQGMHEVLSSSEIRDIQNNKRGWRLEECKKLSVYAVSKKYNLELDSEVAVHDFLCALCLLLPAWQDNPYKLMIHVDNFFQANPRGFLSARNLRNDYEKNKRNASIAIFLKQLGLRSNKTGLSLGFRHLFATTISPLLNYLYDLEHRKHDETLQSISAMHDSIPLPRKCIFIILAFFDKDAELYPSDQIETPNTITAYYQHEPGYLFFSQRGHFELGKPISKKINNIIEFIEADDPLAETVQDLPSSFSQ